MPGLSISEMNLRVKKQHILQDVSLDIPAGSIVALLGPSGSGKSSLLRTIMGLQDPTSGNMTWNNRSIITDGRSVVAATDRPFSYLFQDFTLFPHLNVQKNILIGLQHLPKDRRKEQLDHFASLFAIADLLPRQIEHLSGGEQQRVALARTLAAQPQVLLLDEPFSNLDRHTKLALYKAIKSYLREHNLTAIMATHDHEEAFYFADRMIVLREGLVHGDAAPRELYHHPQTAWLARFTGPANVLPTAVVTQLSPTWRPTGDHTEWLLRPEDLCLSNQGDTPMQQTGITGLNGTITDVTYLGSHSIVDVNASAPHLHVHVEVPADNAATHTIGDAVQVHLRPDCAPRGLDS